MPKPSVLDRPEMRCEVCDRSVECDELRIVEFGYVDAEAMVDGGDEVQEIHRVDVETLAQVPRRVDGRQINLGCEHLGVSLDDHVANLIRFFAALE